MVYLVYFVYMVYFVYLVYMVIFVYVVYLVDLVYMVCLVRISSTQHTTSSAIVIACSYSSWVTGSEGPG